MFQNQMKMLISCLPQGTLLSLFQTTQQQLTISSEPSGKASWDKSCWTDPRHLSEHNKTVQYLTLTPHLQWNSVYNVVCFLAL